MWISLSWLRDYVDLGDRSPEQIAEDLTMRTALIEGIERRGELSPGIVVGRVVERVVHPDADRLSICQVDHGDGISTVVCGASNVVAGQEVVVARVGSTLPNGTEIARSKIRGVASEGMICSLAELGIGDSNEGIAVLDDGAPLGTPFRELAGVVDVLLDIDNKSVTHRPDLWGHLGFARELAAIYRTDLCEPTIDTTLTSGIGEIAVSIEAPELCGRYHALRFRGEIGGRAPAWMRRRLEHCGQRSLRLAVDVSNYMMLELGQPTHPFDRAKLQGDRIIVRRSKPGERIVSLDGEDRALPEGSCVIADETRAIAVGGIIGGETSGIDATTVEGILESAWFDPIAVRRTSTALSLRTEALARFEKFIDPELCERGVRRFASLLKQVAPSVEIDATYTSAGSTTTPAVQLKLRPARVRAKLGVDIDGDAMVDILRRLGFGVAQDGADLRVDVPGSRSTRDVLMEDDLIEEVGRIHGYDRIVPVDAELVCAPVELEPVNAATRTVSSLMTGRFGFTEVLSYPFVEESILARAGGAEELPYVRLKNPLQQSASRLRRSLAPWMLEFVDRNVKSLDEVRLFECGRAFVHGGDYSKLPYEPQMMVAAWGTRAPRKGDAGKVLRRLKGVVEEVGERLERRMTCSAASGGEIPHWAHPGRVARIEFEEDPVGWIGSVHPSVVDRFGWLGEVALFEIDLTYLINAEPNGVKYHPPSRFPGTYRDISFVAPFSLPYSEVSRGLQSTSELVDRVDLVDEYVASGAASGDRSLTLRLSFQANDRTLTDDEVQEVFAAAQEWLRQSGVQLRG